MHIRTTLAVALGAAVLIVATPTSASAAGGEFRYQYADQSGATQTGRLIDPPSRECITLPEVADYGTSPADSPRNDTDATAVVFTNDDCTGDWYALRPSGGRASARLKLRSVVFS